MLISGTPAQKHRWGLIRRTCQQDVQSRQTINKIGMKH